MEAIKKQASKLREQVAKQQQAVLKQLSGRFAFEAPTVDEPDAECHQQLQMLYKSTREAKHFQRNIVRGLEGLISASSRQMEIASKLADACCKYGENENSDAVLARTSLHFGNSRRSMEGEREKLLKILGGQVYEPLRTLIAGAPLEDARHLVHCYEKLRQEVEAQAVDVARRQLKSKDAGGAPEGSLKLQHSELRLSELGSALTALGREATSAMNSVAADQQRITFQQLLAMVDAERNYHHNVASILDELHDAMVLERQESGSERRPASAVTGVLALAVCEGIQEEELQPDDPPENHINGVHGRETNDKTELNQPPTSLSLSHSLCCSLCRDRMAVPDDSAGIHVPETPLDEKKTVIEEGNTEKFVVDEVSGWLRVFSDGTVDRTWTGPPEVQFLATPYFPSSASAAADGVTLHDFTVDTFSGLALRVYLPAGSEAEEGEHFPVLLHFHGGGFCISRPSWYMYYHFYSRLAAATGAAVVSVYTRPAPEHRLPAAVHDCFAGLLWLRSLAQSPTAASDDHPAVAALRRRGDFSRVFLIGDSSGGNLVHEVAALAGKEEDDFWAPLRLAGGVPIHPGFVRSTRSRSEMDRSLETPFLTLDMLDKFLSLSLPEGATKDHPITCPMGPQAPEMAGLRMPPLMVVVAERDLIRDTEMEYCEAMKATGKEVEVVEEPGVGHSFYLNKLAVDSDPHVGNQTTALIEAIKDFVKRH